MSAIYNGSNISEKTINEYRPLYVLNSFYEGEKLCLKAKETAQKGFLLDSGAFTFMNGKEATIPIIEEYLHSYCEFIKKHNIKYFLEMDLDSVFGYKQAKGWRDEIEKETNSQTIPVWHISRGVNNFKQTIKDYDYVAIGGFAINEITPKNFNNIRKLNIFALKNNVKIHGLGYSRKNILEMKFYSVDSTSYKLEAIRGQGVWTFENGEIKTKRIISNKKANLSKMATHNYKQAIKYQKYLEGVKN